LRYRWRGDRDGDINGDRDGDGEEIEMLSKTEMMRETVIVREMYKEMEGVEIDNPGLRFRDNAIVKFNRLTYSCANILVHQCPLCKLAMRRDYFFLFWCANTIGTEANGAHIVLSHYNLQEKQTCSVRLTY